MSTSPSTQTSHSLARSKPVKKKQEQIESALRAALFLHDHSNSRWAKLFEHGATDEEITHGLVDEFGSGGSSQTAGGIQFAYKGQPEPLFWLNASTHYTSMKATLQGKSLIRRVREVLNIPVPGRPEVAFELTAAEMIERIKQAKTLKDLQGYDAAVIAPELARSTVLSAEEKAAVRELLNTQIQALNKSKAPRGDGKGQKARLLEAISERANKSDAHEFKPTTSRDGRCSVCNKGSDTEQHRAFRAEQRAREQSGQPKQTAEGWREKAAGMFEHVTRYRENPHKGKSLTDARQRDWESKLLSATTHQRWGLTIEAIAVLVESGQLPRVLNSLTTQYQVRHLMDCVIEGRKLPGYGMPQSMGPTIKTVEDFAEAVKALSPLVPVISPYTVDGELHGYGADGATEPAPLVEAAAAETAQAKDRGCGGPCEHTDEEHAAFDAGVIAGEIGVDESACPYPGDASLCEAWLTGYSVGVGNRIETLASPGVVEVFYALDLYGDGSHDITSQGKDSSVDLVKEDSTAVIGVNSQGVMRVVSVHNIERTHTDIIESYGGDARFLKPHRYTAGDAEDEPPCCHLPEFEAIHIKAAPEAQAGASHAQAATPVAIIAPVAKPFTEEMEVELNDHDIAVKAKLAAALATEIAQLEAEKKETDGVYKKKIGGKEEERDKLLSEIGRGHASIPVQVYARPDYGRKVVETVRVDDGAVLKTRPMKPREYQEPLPIL